MNKSTENYMDLEFLELQKILKNKDISTVFQSIVSLKDGKIIGYECLSRGPKDSLLHNPKKLFEVAEKHNKLIDLDLLCRFKAIENLKDIDKDKLIFINVRLQTFIKEKSEEDCTMRFLVRNNISPKNIVLEINEKEYIEDYNKFNIAFKNSTVKGYKIALDDIGSGYSRFKAISESKPKYIKIDKDLVSNIDKDLIKQSVMKSLVLLANDIEMIVIAEGIENENELLTLIKLDVHAGQGYFLQKPESNIKTISDTIMKSIITYNRIY